MADLADHDARNTHLTMTDARMKTALDGRTNIPLLETDLSPTLFGLPWGGFVALVAPSHRQLISAGPAQYRAGRWLLPIFLHSVEETDTTTTLLREARRERKDFGIEGPRR